MRIDQAITAALTPLKAAGSPSPRLDAEVLLAHVLKTTREALLLAPETELTPARLRAFRGAVARRLKREPVARITGTKEFWSLPFRVAPGTLIPRPDTETLVEEVLERIGPLGRDRRWRILDLGTGSGCILLALLTELSSATGLGIDISAAALKVARANARALGLDTRARFARFDWADGKALPRLRGGRLGGPFDIVVCNPPYVPSGEIGWLEPEVAAFDPKAALDGGEDGLMHYRAITGRAHTFLDPEEGGLIAFEVDEANAHRVAALLEKAGFTGLRTRRDLSGRTRALSAGLPVH